MEQRNRGWMQRNADGATQPRMDADGRRWTQMDADGGGPQVDADERRSRINQITEKVIGCVFRVSNTLGAGFLEKVYHNALLIELREAGLAVSPQHPISVLYKGHVVGEYFADLLVEGLVIVEVKAVTALNEVHQAQCINYLKASGLSVCLLINFAKPKAEVRRLVRDF